ncbi:MAG TPA: hypothetical protein VJS44_02565 [Pyrinomonadaceae bacterium]|nr:hypothetical protein [Pyrinomonadaceae bacterium]
MQARSGWPLGFAVAFATLILAIYPQLNLWYLTGNQWHGIYAYNDIDEVAYAAYLKALIDGRPRRNDPYTGRDDHAQAPQQESLFSIQFLPPFVTAKLARVFGLNISWAMIALSAVMGFLAALVLFRLIAKITGDVWLAAVGALAVVCLGTLVCGQGAILELIGRDIAYPYLPFMRRYVPLFPFPFFFLMCGLVWKTLTGSDARRKLWTAAGAGLLFAVLVYSYFYIWTTAAAWLACLALVLVLARPEGWRRELKYLCITGGLAALSLVPYALMLSRRAQVMDSVQLLSFTRAPDLARAPEIISLIVLCALMLCVKRGRVELKQRSTLFTISLALTPYAVFNQQIITGRSLQPIHYEVFIANYLSLLAAILCLSLIVRGKREEERKAILPGWVMCCVALLVFGWGFVEARVTTRVLNPHNELRNGAAPVLDRLAQIAREGGDARPVTEQLVYSSDNILADEVPTLAPQPVLWARHQHIFVGATAEESRERFFHWMYYTGYDAESLNHALRQGNFAIVYALFGWGRLTNRLVADPQPLTEGEIQGEVKAYGDFVASFNRASASRLALSYLIAPAEHAEVPARISEWYEHDQGERRGDFVLYRLRLKP